MFWYSHSYIQIYRVCRLKGEVPLQVHRVPLDLPRRPCWGRRGRSWTWRPSSPWRLMIGGSKETDWLKDGWMDRWMEWWRCWRLSVCRSRWGRRAAVGSSSCLSHKFSESDWLLEALMITWSHACGGKWGGEGVSDGAGPVQLPPRHLVSLTCSMRRVRFQVTIMSRRIHGRSI